MNKPYYVLEEDWHLYLTAIVSSTIEMPVGMKVLNAYEKVTDLLTKHKYYTMNDKERQEEQDFQELLTGVDEFGKAMKARLTEMHERGIRSYKEESLEHSEYQIQKVSTEIGFNKPKDIDTANWCLIHYMNRRK